MSSHVKGGNLLTRLTDSQRALRLLQTKFSTREIADQLGYKDVRNINLILQGKRNLTQGKLSQAEALVSENVTRKSIPTPKEIKEKQKQIKQSTSNGWRKTTMNQFFRSIKVLDLQLLKDRLFQTGKYAKYRKGTVIQYAYYNPKMKLYLLLNQNRPAKDIEANYTTGFLFEFAFEVEERGNLKQILQYPIYMWHSIVPARDSFKQIMHDVDRYYKHHEYDGKETNPFYETLVNEDHLVFLALVGEL